MWSDRRDGVVCLQSFLLNSGVLRFVYKSFCLSLHCYHTDTLIFPDCNNTLDPTVPILSSSNYTLTTLVYTITLVLTQSDFYHCVTVSTFHYAVSLTFQQFYHIVAILFPLIVNILLPCCHYTGTLLFTRLKDGVVI